MRLADILSGCGYDGLLSSGMDNANLEQKNSAKPASYGAPAFLDAGISGVTYDSRKVVSGNIFVALKGENFDGNNFIQSAVEKGAAAIVYEREIDCILQEEGREQGMNPSVVFIRVKDARDSLACLSNNFYKRPSEDISVIGITGTNGKTTTTYIIKAILEALEEKVGIIGTIGYLVGDRRYPALHTTPEAPEFQGLLRRMVSAGCSHIITEVSSHSLSQKRVDYTSFEVAVFTNLTRDHLDFHHDMKNYYEAKKRLFRSLLSDKGTAVVNADDEWGRRLLTELQGVSSVLTYGIVNDADIRATDIECSFSGISFTLKHKTGSFRLSSGLLGMTSVYNILAATSAALALGISAEAIIKGVKNIRHIKGRFENINCGQDFLCIVDYAHTPDALERLITTARELLNNVIGRQADSFVAGKPACSDFFAARPSSRLITVFGCGGNRDHGKRPLMGEIAVRLSDYVIITSDNPRKEKPEAIIKDIESGIRTDNYISVPDRRVAIKLAVEKAEAGDIVIVAGKGHEDYQEIGNQRYGFSDVEIISEAIKNKLRDKVNNAG